MKKLLTVFLTLLTIQSHAFGITIGELYHGAIYLTHEINGWCDVTFTNSSVLFTPRANTSGIVGKEYSLPYGNFEKDGITFITIGTFKYILMTYKDSLVDAIFLIGPHGGFFSSKKNPIGIEELDDRIIKRSATSYLIEGKTKYPPSNLRDFEKPWASGNGFGIGDIITVEVRETYKRVTGLMIANGYLSYSDPWLYVANSRVKRIEIKETRSMKSCIYELQDTYNFQLLDITDIKDFYVNGDVFKLEIKILEVYPGTKFDDLCINIIMSDFTKRP